MQNVLEYLLANAELRPDAPAFSDEKCSISFSALLRRVRSLGREIHVQTGTVFL